MRPYHHPIKRGAGKYAVFLARDPGKDGTDDMLTRVQSMDEAREMERRLNEREVARFGVHAPLAYAVELKRVSRIKE